MHEITVIHGLFQQLNADVGDIMYDIVIIHGLSEQLKKEVGDIIYDVVVLQGLYQQLNADVGYAWIISTADESRTYIYKSVPWHDESKILA